MNRYLLLRDNKQTGPYTVAELAEKGIKAYDLVWLDGKSAAWRYPSEVEELKPFSPVVEEQPFDRFFKKPTDKEIVTESALERARKRAMAEAENAAIQYIPREPVSATAPKPPAINKETPEVREFVLPVDAKSSSKKVYVDLPGKTGAPRSESVKKLEVVVNNLAEKATPAPIEKYSIPEPITITTELSKVTLAHQRFMPVTTPENEVVDRPVRHEPKTPVAESESDFGNEPARSRQELRPMIPASASVSQKKSARPTPVMLLIGALCLLLGGVVIGLVISNSGEKDSSEDLGKIIAGIKAREEEKKLVQQRSLQISQVSQPLPAGSDELLYKDGQEEQPVSQPKATKKIITSKDSQSKPVGDTKPNQSGSEALPSKQNEETGVRTSVTREDKPQVNEASENARKNIRQLVSVQKNKYRTGVLGGISELELTLMNSSEFELDMVEVEIAYLGPERRVINTQTVVFNNIKPGKQSVQDVPRTKRGVSVNTTIKSIHSKSLGLAYSGL